MERVARGERAAGPQAGRHAAVQALRPADPGRGGGQGVALGRIPLIAEHLRDGRLVAPFPKRYESARGLLRGGRAARRRVVPTWRRSSTGSRTKRRARWASGRLRLRAPAHRAMSDARGARGAPRSRRRRGSSASRALVPAGARVLDLACGTRPPRATLRGPRLPRARRRSRRRGARRARRRRGHRDRARSTSKPARGRSRASASTRSSSRTTCIARSSRHLLAALADGRRAALRDVRARQRSVRPSVESRFPARAGRASARGRGRLTVVAFEQGLVDEGGRRAVVQRLAAVGQRASVAGGAAARRVDGLTRPGGRGSNAVKSRLLPQLPMLTGSIVAIATPMPEGGALDLPALSPS